VSIGRNIIDRHGERPCIPNCYALAKALAEGRPPTLRSRITKALAALRRRIAQ